MTIKADSVTCGTCCFIQVKDLFYLWKQKKERTLLDTYRTLINEGKQETDFIKIIDLPTLRIIFNEETLISFDEYRKMPLPILVSEIFQKFSLGLEFGNKAGAKQAIKDLKDIIAYKTGTLNYEIPAVPTGRIVFMQGNSAFSSTQFEHTYLYRTLNKDDASKQEHRAYLLECILNIYDLDFPGYTKDELEYTITKKGNNLLIHISPTKKKNIINQYLTKRNKKTQSQN